MAGTSLGVRSCSCAGQRYFFDRRKAIKGERNTEIIVLFLLFHFVLASHASFSKEGSAPLAPSTHLFRVFSTIQGRYLAVGNARAPSLVGPPPAALWRSGAPVRREPKLLTGRSGDRSGSVVQ